MFDCVYVCVYVYATIATLNITRKEIVLCRGQQAGRSAGSECGQFFYDYLGLGLICRGVYLLLGFNSIPR